MNANLTIADAEEINALHDAALNLAGQAVAKAAECGQKLIEAKAKCKHGEWLPWMEANLKFTRRTATSYMSVAEANGKHASLLDGTTSIREALSLIPYLDQMPDAGEDTTAEEVRQFKVERDAAVASRDKVIRELMDKEASIRDLKAQIADDREVHEEQLREVRIQIQAEEAAKPRTDAEVAAKAARLAELKREETRTLEAISKAKYDLRKSHEELEAAQRRNKLEAKLLADQYDVSLKFHQDAAMLIGTSQALSGIPLTDDLNAQLHTAIRDADAVGDSLRALLKVERVITGECTEVGDDTALKARVAELEAELAGEALDPRLKELMVDLEVDSVVDLVESLVGIAGEAILKHDEVMAALAAANQENERLQAELAAASPPGPEEEKPKTKGKKVSIPKKPTPTEGTLSAAEFLGAA
jgi:hypothetical protein